MINPQTETNNQLKEMQQLKLRENRKIKELMFWCFALGLSIATIFWVTYLYDFDVKWPGEKDFKITLISNIYEPTEYPLPTRTGRCAQLQLKIKWLQEYSGNKEISGLRLRYHKKFNDSCYFTANLDKVPLKQKHIDKAKVSFKDALENL